MSYRSKRTRLGAASKSKEIKGRSVEAIVAEVVADAAAREVEDDETLRSSCYNQSTDQAIDQPTEVTYTDADDVRPNMGKRSRRESLGPSPSQPSAANPSSELRSSRRLSALVQDTSVHPNNGVSLRGGLAVETVLSSSHNIWMDDPLNSDPQQATMTEVNDGRPHKKNMADSKLHTRQSSQMHPDDSPSQLRASKRQSFLVHEDVGEPSDRGLFQERHSKPSNWTDDIEFDEMEEVEMRDLEGRRGKKGGRILPRHVWSLQPGVRFVVPVNALDQPVRKGGHVLVKFLGDVAKNGEFCPIGEVNWHKVDKRCKANIITLVRDKFVLPPRDEIDKSILKHVGKKWRCYRYELKMQFKKPDKTQEQIASIVPKGVDVSQWEKLVQYWFSEKCQSLSAKGKEARASQSHLHTTGAKSFAQMRDEFERAHGREPGALEWFARTHLRKDGTCVENSSKEFLDAAAAMVAQRGSTSSPAKRIAIENQVFNELMYSDDEKSYRPIGYGFGANINKVSGVGGELRKRGYMNSDISGNFTRNKLSESKRHDYSALDTIKEVERLSFAMTAMSETNELMQIQIQRQSQQLKIQAQQLQLQSEQMEGLQFQLQQVTSLLTKFGVMLNNPQNGPTRGGTSRQRRNVLNTPVPGSSSGDSDSDSDSIEWE